MGHGEHQRLTVATKPNAKFGKLDCLTTTTWFTSKRTGTARTDISAVTWCLTAQGLPASEYQRGNPQVVPPWLNLTLVSSRRVRTEVRLPADVIYRGAQRFTGTGVGGVLTIPITRSIGALALCKEWSDRPRKQHRRLASRGNARRNLAWPPTLMIVLEPRQTTTDLPDAEALIN